MSFTRSGVLFLANLFLATNLFGAKYDGRFGLRVHAGAAPYAGYIRSKANTEAAIAASGSSGGIGELSNYLAAGFVFPLELYATVGLTPAFELALGGKYAPSVLLHGRDPYYSPISTGLGFRYYINPDENVKGFLGNQVSVGFNPLSIEGMASFGLQWDLGKFVSIFAQESICLVGVVPKSQDIEFGFEAAFLFSLGLQVHF